MKTILSTLLLITSLYAQASSFELNQYLFLAACKDQPQQIERLLRMGAEIDNRVVEDTPLHCASSNNAVSAIKMLIEKGANVHSENLLWGDHPISRAAENGAYEAIGVLLSSGAMVDVPDYLGRTPIHIAAEKGNLETTMLLIDFGADIFKRNRDTAGTVIHSASYSGNEKLVEYLIELGASINDRDRLKNTPLHTAARVNSLPVAKILIKHGADLSLRNEEGLSPALVAKKNKNYKLFNYLRSL